MFESIDGFDRVYLVPVPASASRHCSRKAVRSRGRTFSFSAFLAQSLCLICSARRFSAASRYSGATVDGSTSFSAKDGAVRTSERNVTRIKEFKFSLRLKKLGKKAWPAGPADPSSKKQKSGGLRKILQVLCPSSLAGQGYPRRSRHPVFRGRRPRRSTTIARPIATATRIAPCRI